MLCIAFGIDMMYEYMYPLKRRSCACQSIFTRESSYCFQRVLAIAILSVRLSVRLSVTRVDQSKAVQARITKSYHRLPERL